MKTIKLIDKLIGQEFEIRNNLSELHDFTILKDSWLDKVINTTVDNLMGFFRRHFDFVEVYLIWVRMSGTKLRKNKSYSSIIYS